MLSDKGGVGGKQAFPFGYGLDYLDVSIQNSSATVHQGDFASEGGEPAPMSVDVTLHNAASVGGGYVVQVYLTPPVSPSRLTRYRHMLGGFAKVHIGASADVSVSIPILARDLAHFDPITNGHVVDKGPYTLYVCHDSRGLKSDGARAEGIKAEDGHCQTHTVTL